MSCSWLIECMGNIMIICETYYVTLSWASNIILYIIVYVSGGMLVVFPVTALFLKQQKMYDKYLQCAEGHFPSGASVVTIYQQSKPAIKVNRFFFNINKMFSFFTLDWSPTHIRRCQKSQGGLCPLLRITITLGEITREYFDFSRCKVPNLPCNCTHALWNSTFKCYQRFFLSKKFVLGMLRKFSCK